VGGDGGRRQGPRDDGTPRAAALNTFSTPGAPPNGSDYVRLRNASGQYLTTAQLSSLSFQGAKSLPAKPIEWTVDSGALYSGTGDLLDRAIVRQVTVPGSGATLAFDTRWNLEETWDFGFVQVSTDGGATYTSVQCADSRSDFNPAAHPTVMANVPGFTGVQDWKNETCDLSAYAG
jgi:bacillopeptidase F (M6 metalloprotease family)